MKNLFGLLLALWLVSPVCAQKWPTFRRDHARSGATATKIDATRFQPSWTWRAELPPDPAWDGPARWDAYNNIRDLPAMRQYDACFHPVSDGHTVYLGSSSQDSLTAIDLDNGEVLWTYTAGGPIRLAPTIYKNKVLFGCDDGFAYCLDGKSGELVWRFNPAEQSGSEQRRLLNNDRLISYYPIRTGITIRDDIAYFGASFLPWRESYICAVDAESGTTTESKNTYVVRHEKATLEGNLLVAEDRLIVPQGRIAPLLFQRSTGKSLGSLPGGGGVTIVLTESGEVVRSEGGRAARNGQVGVFKGKERVASFPRGRAIVIASNTFYVIDGQKLFAADRDTNELKWTREVDEPLELIMAGNTLFVGGRDHVTAVDAATGDVTWSAKTEGRVFGLAVAGQKLLAATDNGTLHAYAPTRISQPKPARKTTDSDPWPSPPVAKVRDNNLLHRWVFHRTAMSMPDKLSVDTQHVEHVTVTDQAGSLDLKLDGSADIVRIARSNRTEAIQLAGDFFPIPNAKLPALPVKAIAVEAWVRVDQPETWGGIVGCIQDDGSVEYGWLLGYRDDRFCFAITGGRPGLTYLNAKASFQPKSWNHVVGTYDGREMRLYVNGVLAATSTAERGPINYDGKMVFTVGAYRDANETYPLKGALHEIRIYDAAIDASDVSSLFVAGAKDFEIQQKAGAARSFLTWGPVTRFVRRGEIEITYGTAQECPSVVDLITDEGIKRHATPAPTKEHRLTVSGLPFRRELQFQIRDENADSGEVTENFSLDTHFDWTSTNTQTPSPAIAALIDECPNPRGLALVIGIDNESRALQLADQTLMTVVLVAPSEKDATRIRQRWTNDPNVIYGRELSVIAAPLNELPAASAAVVVTRQSKESTRRLVRPAGGIEYDGTQVVWKRKPVKGSGVWSHMYGTADNSAYGGEHLSGASDRKDLVTQWIGRPGPRYQTDRQNRKPSPLAAGGRLFLQGQQRLISLDSFSGNVLWSLETPTVMRWNVPHDCSNWCADERGVFVAAANQAWFIDGKTGTVDQRFNVPVKPGNSKNKSWGFISRYENQLIGSVVDSSAIYTKWWGKTQWFDSTGGPDTHVVAGEQLFSLNRDSGELNWSYDGLILHPTITLMDDFVYFVEDKTPAHLNSKTRRIALSKGQQFEIVCLSVADGVRKWSHPLPPFAGHIASLYLAGGGEQANRCLVLAASESTKKEFDVRAFNPDTGDSIWHQSVAWEATHHGKHISRPALQGDLLYLRPEVLNLADGSRLHRGFPGGHGCSSYTLSANGLFSRLGETTWWDVRTQKVNRFERIRTDCWISVVPAQGMILSAEGGGGCSCGSWLETSLGFLPRSVDEELPEK